MKAICHQIGLFGARLTMSLCALTIFSTAGIAQSTPNPTEQLSPTEYSISNEQQQLKNPALTVGFPLPAIAEELYIESEKRTLAALPPPDPVVEGTVNLDVQRPSFIPAEAFSNENMVAPYHDLEGHWWDKRAISDIPQRIKLSPSVAQYWNGTKIEPYWVTTVEDVEHPGNLTFFSEYADGPQGWLQSTGERSAWGNPEYRYWFNPK